MIRKIALICTLLVGGYAASSISVNAVENSVTYSMGKELPDDARSITVYKVVQVGGNAWSTSAYSAYYSRSENCIYITEGRRQNQPYSVYENRAYGQSKDGRAEYRYTAGGYYFNL